MNTINKNLKVGTKVSYIKFNTSAESNEYKQAVITGEYHDGRFNWICLDNGDKMFAQALTVWEEPTESVNAERNTTEVIKRINELVDNKTLSPIDSVQRGIEIINESRGSLSKEAEKFFDNLMILWTKNLLQ